MADHVARLAGGTRAIEPTSQTAPVAQGTREIAALRADQCAPFAHGASRRAVRRQRTSQPSGHIASQAAVGGGS